MSRINQLRWSHEHGLKHTNGYCDSPEANLPWLNACIRREIEAGDGNEFGRPGERARIAALHSSAALAVNFFGYWTTRDPAPLQSALGLEASIERIQFEAKFPTPVGPRAPNLDVILHLANGTLLAIESKFTEWLGSPGRKALREDYFAEGRRYWAEAGLAGAQSIAETYADSCRFRHLDVSQLLKHMLGLASQPRPWRLMLLWYEQPIVQSGLLRAEASRFGRLLKGDAARFSSLEYQELWKRLEERLGPDDRAYADYMSARYFSAQLKAEDLAARGALPGGFALAPKALEDRMNDEAQWADPEVMEKFMREHGGLTPVQYALAQFPEAAKEVGEEFLHLVPPPHKD